MQLKSPYNISFYVTIYINTIIVGNNNDGYLMCHIVDHLYHIISSSYKSFSYILILEAHTSRIGENCF